MLTHCGASLPSIILAFLITTLHLHSNASSLSLNKNQIVNMPPTKSNVRVELFFKGKADLKERIQFLSSHGISAFNIVNKSRQDTVEEWMETIQEEFNNHKSSSSSKDEKCSICAHYSLKFNKSATRKNRDEASYEKFRSFLQSDAVQSYDLQNKKLTEVLLISGSGDKAKLDPIETLQRLNADTTIPSDDNYLPTLAVAYNPFFPFEKQQEVERERLIQKLETNQVDKIYLQFGTNLETLQLSLQWLSEMRTKYDVSLSASIFLPTKKLIAQQKFRPWNGVFLSEEFLNSPENAYSIVVQMMKMYKEYDVEILIEAPGVRNEKDMTVVEQLLNDRDGIENTDLASIGKDTTVEARDEEEVDVNGNKIPVGKRRKIHSSSKITPSPLVTKEALSKPAILLFGSHDVRVHDNEAFQLASCHSSVIPVFLWDKQSQGQWGVTGALEVVLKDALKNLKTKFKNHGLDLICKNIYEEEDFHFEVLKLCQESGSCTLYMNKEHTTESRIREDKIMKILKENDIATVSCQSSLLYDPTALSLSGGFNGGHWGTLMPFLKGCKKQLGEPRRPMAKHETFALLEKIQGPEVWPSGTEIEDLDMGIVRGKDKWDLPILERFPMSEDKAMNDLDTFMKKGFHLYEKERSRADLMHSTSKLSPHLRLGTLSPNELYYRVEDSALSYDDKKTFSRRLFWRDLAYYHLLNFPQMRNISIRGHYEDTEWCDGEEEERRFKAWKTGMTGYPLVDAGMRELYHTGWMTQSIRMVVASFLTEYLRVNWVKGCEWFHYTLVDSDSAINAMMWQNAGRSGIDQWNFVMSPVAASQDATGMYTKKWVPELSKLSKPVLHKPWEAPEMVLSNAGIVLGETYPNRIVTDLPAERETSVENVLKMRRNSQQYNDKKGYDLITLPAGEKTVVFTKKEYRIDSKGIVIPSTSERKSPKGKNSNKPQGRGRRGRQRVSK